MILSQPCRQMLERNGASFGSSRWCFRFAWARNRHDGLPSSEARKCAGCKRYDLEALRKAVFPRQPAQNRPCRQRAGALERKVRRGLRGIGVISWNRSGNEADRNGNVVLRRRPLSGERTKAPGLPMTRLGTSARSSATAQRDAGARSRRRSARTGTVHAVLAFRRWPEDVNGAFTMSRHGFRSCRPRGTSQTSRRYPFMLHQPAPEPISSIRETALYGPVKRFLEGLGF